VLVFDRKWPWIEKLVSTKIKGVALSSRAFYFAWILSI